MKATFIGHACLLIESNGLSILSDPWWRGPCFGAQWWLFPQPFLEVLEGRPIDYIYISHGHHDHYHPPTLKTLDRTAKILIAKDSDLCQPIKALGFDVVEVPEAAEYNLGRGVRCRILRTKNDDTMMAISDGKEVCLNINDALHALPASIHKKFIRAIRTIYPTIDYVFCGYGTASHFPNCYIIPGKDRERTAAKRQSYFNRAWSDIIFELAPRFGFPFAADVVFLDDALFWSNEVIHNSERPTDVFRHQYPDSPTTVIDIAPGFIIENSQVISYQIRQMLSNSEVQTFYQDNIRRVNRHDNSSQIGLVKQIAEVLEKNISICYPYLSHFDNDYNCLIKFLNAKESILIKKERKKFSVSIVQEYSCHNESYDVIYITRTSYLMRSLTSQYGYEILFVGSGGIFEYKNVSKLSLNINREIMTALTRMDKCPDRHTQAEGITTKIKNFIKMVIGNVDEDLYNLYQWTVFSS